MNLSNLSVRVKNKIRNNFFRILVLPIKTAIAVINTARRLFPSKLLEEVISEFRSRLHAELSKTTDSAYLIRNPSDPKVELTYVDIGARGGLPDIIAKNLGVFKNIVMCEGEPTEARKLREQGYRVIDTFVTDTCGDAKFFLIRTHHPASSLKRPGTPFLHLFSSAHFAELTDYSEHDVKTSTLDIELKKLGVASIDFIKLDIQGAELSAIRGLTSIHPLFWEVEVLQLPTYQDTPYGVEISAELTKRGYICFRKTSQHCNDGLFLYSNERYMPNYATEFGKALITENFDRWRAMIEIFDITTLGAHVEDVIRGIKPSR